MATMTAVVLGDLRYSMTIGGRPATWRVTRIVGDCCDLEHAEAPARRKLPPQRVALDVAARLDVVECRIRIDQGDYLEQRGGNDWGRGDYGDVFASVAEAQAVVKRLGVAKLVRAYETVRGW